MPQGDQRRVSSACVKRQQQGLQQQGSSWKRRGPDAAYNASRQSKHETSNPFEARHHHDTDPFARTIKLGISGAARNAERFLRHLFSFTTVKIFSVLLVVAGFGAVLLLSGVLGDTTIGLTLTTNPDLERGIVAHWTFDGEDMTLTAASDRVGGNSGTFADMVDITRTASSSSGSDLSTYTFSSLSFGAAETGRLVVVGVLGTDNAVTALNSVSIGGGAATIVEQATLDIGTAVIHSAIAVRQIDTGTSGDVVLTFAAPMARAAVIVWRMTGASGVTPFDTDTDTVNNTSSPTSVNIDIPAHGGAIAMAAANGSGITLATAGLTEDDDFLVETNNDRAAGSHNEFSTAQGGHNITVTPGGNHFGSLAAASWAPVFSATPTSGRIGQGLDFDGVDDYVDMGTVSALNVPEFSVAAWVKGDVAPESGEITTVFQKSSSDSQNAGTIAFDWSHTSSLVRQSCVVNETPGSSWEPAKLSTTLQANVWYHIVCTYDGTTLRAYLNGVQEDTAVPSNVSTGNSAFRIGAGGDNGATPGNYFDGTVDDLRYYDRALSAAEISRLYDLGATTKIDTTLDVFPDLKKQLQAHWTFDGPHVDWSQSTAESRDQSGNGKHGNVNFSQTAAFPGQIGQSFFFNGSSDEHSFTSTDLGTVNTIAAWVKLFSAPGNYCVVCGADNFYAPRIDASTVFYRVNDSTGASVTHGLSVGEWAHMVVVRNGTSVTFYKNGAQLGSTQTLGTSPSNTVVSLVGRGNSGAGANFYFSGFIDDVRLYDRVLSGSQISHLYDLGATTKVNTTLITNPDLERGLIGHWTLDGKHIGSAVVDRASGSHGYIRNVATTSATVAGLIGQGLTFDGVDDDITLGSPTALDNVNTGPISVALWLKAVTAGESNIGFLVATQSGTGQWQFSTDSTGTETLAIEFHKDYATTDFNVHSANNAFTLDEWTHVAMTWNGGSAVSDVVFYSNGAAIGQGLGDAGVGAVVSSTALNHFISGRGDGTRIINGVVDDVRIYNRVLTADEIKRVYDLGGRR